jgi:hypothetical protein
MLAGIAALTGVSAGIGVSIASGTGASGAAIPTLDLAFRKATCRQLVNTGCGSRTDPPAISLRRNGSEVSHSAGLIGPASRSDRTPLCDKKRPSVFADGRAKLSLVETTFS